MTRHIFFILAFFALSSGTVFYVHPDSTLNSIQAALNLCNMNDTVLVGPGVYFENINWPLTPGIDLVSEKDFDSTIIDGGDLNSVIMIDGYSSSAHDSGTIICGFTIRNGHAVYDGGGLYIFKASPQIIHNRITGNRVSRRGGGGIFFYGSASVVRDNIIDNNYSPRYGGGIQIEYTDAIYIRNNIFESNLADSFGGGVSLYSFRGNFMFNTIRNNHTGCFGGGIYGQYASMSSVVCNNIYGNNNCGLYSADSFGNFDAENNWWGDSTGPFHESLNPGGLGDTVSDYVDFIPWLTSPFGIAEQRVAVNDAVRMIITPNPFRIVTAINLEASTQDVRIYDASGRMVKDMTDYISGKTPAVHWNGTDDHDRRVAPGIYFVRSRTNGTIATGKLVFLK